MRNTILSMGQEIRVPDLVSYARDKAKFRGTKELIWFSTGGSCVNNYVLVSGGMVMLFPCLK